MKLITWVMVTDIHGDILYDSAWQPLQTWSRKRRKRVQHHKSIIAQPSPQPQHGQIGLAVAIAILFALLAVLVGRV